MVTKVLVNKNDINKLSSILFAIIALVLISALYQGGSTLGTNDLRKILKIIVFTFSAVNVLIVSIGLVKRQKVKLINIIATLPMVLFYIISNTYTYQTFATSTSTIYLVLWVTYCLSSTDVKIDSFKILYNVWVVICFFGIICYIAYMVDLPIPYDIVSYYGSNKNAAYVDYKIVYVYKVHNFVRLCGICNEPGYLGTICGLLLCANKMNFRCKKNIIIFIAGLLSFSLAFYVMVLVYFVLKSWKNWRFLLAIVVIVLSYIYILPNVNINNPNINKILSRFKVSEGKLKGDDRSNSYIDNEYEYVLRSNPFFGKGNGYAKSRMAGSTATYKVFVIEYGFIGVLIIWGLLLIISLYGNLKNYDVVVYIIIFFMSLYQRSNIMNFQYEMILFGGIAYAKYYSTIKKDNNKSERKKLIRLRKLSFH